MNTNNTDSSVIQQGRGVLGSLLQRGYGVVAVDFDATITDYKEWKNLGVFDDPLPGCKEALDRLTLKGYTIIINTTRGVDIDKVKRYLCDHQIPYNFINQNHPNAPRNVSDKKVLADVYIDDRAILFDGRWEGMVDRVEWFTPWYKRDNRRPSLNLAVAGCYVDQISLYVDSVRDTTEEYAQLGHDKWVTDSVVAEVTQACSTAPVTLGHQFVVTLAFNYTIFQCEFELIGVTVGHTVQIPRIVTPDTPGLSHYGFHVNDLDQAIETFQLCGYPMMARVRTLSHTGCQHHYEYAFMDTRKLGFISKLIWRIKETSERP